MIFTLIAFVVLLIFATYALSKLKGKKAEAFPKSWQKPLYEHVVFYRTLSPEKQQQFQSRMMQFLSEVTIEGVQLKLTELDRILIAASAVIPVFGFKEWHYTNLSGILLYPDNFNTDYEFGVKNNDKIIAGMVGTGRMEKQMILSKKALYHGFSNNSDKNNTAIHEFVHLIDKMDGETDGVPEYLLKHSYTIPWLKLIHKEMELINNNKSEIRSYGGTSQAEFFAVASEYFFENPKIMKRKHPDLYQMLKACFQTPDKFES